MPVLAPIYGSLSRLQVPQPDHLVCPEIIQRLSVWSHLSYPYRRGMGVRCHVTMEGHSVQCFLIPLGFLNHELKCLGFRMQNFWESLIRHAYQSDSHIGD
ncbi:hypothetical protein J6590_026837 [Homalodisca vitripennis]|nr:hypothetical protein J6590_026837 [Homalodisca vitripennis]